MALGYIAAFSETLALAVIAEKGLEPLCAAVAQETEDHIRAAAAWSLAQVGRHTPDHAKAVADTGDTDFYLSELHEQNQPCRYIQLTLTAERCQVAAPGWLTRSKQLDSGDMRTSCVSSSRL